MDFITAADPEVGRAIQAEYDRQQQNIELIASENVVSSAVLAAAGTVLTNKYAEGYPGKRYYGGCQCVDVVEDIAIQRARQLFGAGFANVQPHSGAQANYAVYQALCQYGDTVLGMSLDNGGHLTHGSPVNFSGKQYKMVAYGVDPVTHRIDYDQVRDLARRHRPKMIIAGASAYPRIIDFQCFAEIAHEVGAYLFVDMAHIAGLVAAGLHPSPIPYADVVSTTTHIQRPSANYAPDEAVRDTLWQAGTYAVAGSPAENGKLTQPPGLSGWMAGADTVLLEADGAKHRPCKAPAAHEPVLLPESDIVLAVAGLSALGRPLAEVCFRLDAACALLGVPPEASLTPERLAKLLASGAGGRKNVGTRAFYVILNQADDAPCRAAGERTLAILKETYNVSGFLTHFEEGERA